MNIRTKILMAGALIAAASTVSAQAVDQTVSDPAADQSATSPTMVYGPRTTGDQRITDDVVDKIANDSRLSGNIGVETERNDVTLTGRVVTPGQVNDAGSDAESVDGVRDVDNIVTPKVGENF
jgi:osmotically-inducible protein OsmY